MADFCYQCTEEFFGDAPDKNDMAGLCKDDEVAHVLCEDCGYIWVDHEGYCQGCNKHGEIIIPLEDLKFNG